MKRKRRVRRRKSKAHKLIKLVTVIGCCLFVGACLMLFTTGQWPTAIWAVEEASHMLGDAWMELVGDA